jgi:hypothetical protein
MHFVVHCCAHVIFLRTAMQREPTCDFVCRIAARRCVFAMAGRVVAFLFPRFDGAVRHLDG